MISLPLWSLADPVTTTTKAADFRVSLEDMMGGTGRLTDGDFANYEADGTAFVVGDVLFGRLRPYLAKSWRADRPGTAGGDIIVMRPTSRVTSGFLGWLVQSEPFVRRASAETRGVKMPRTAWEYLAPVPVWTPPLDQQRRIADYLDAETAQIDGMMAELDELESRVQSRTATRLARDWNAVSATAASIPLQYLAKISVGIVVKPAQYYVPSGTGVPALRGVNVRPGRILADDTVEISMEGDQANHRSRLSTGDVVTVRTGQAGASAVVPPEWSGANAIDLIITRPAEGLDPQFLVAYLNSPVASTEMGLDVVGAVQQHFNVSSMSRLRIPLPDVRAQQELVRAWVAAREETDAMLADIARLKDLLIERRSALITAVVTGTKEIA